LILVDTCVWSLVLRRKGLQARQHPAALRLRTLIEADEPVTLPGIVLQEVLSGVSDEAVHARLAATLASFPTLLATTNDHLQAADIQSACVRRGIAIEAAVALIAAQALEHDAALLTRDADFTRVRTLFDLRLLS
jgi:predicted nucleic acid-binding protein